MIELMIVLICAGAILYMIISMIVSAYMSGGSVRNDHGGRDR